MSEPITPLVEDSSVGINHWRTVKLSLVILGLVGFLLWIVDEWSIPSREGPTPWNVLAVVAFAIGIAYLAYRFQWKRRWRTVTYRFEGAKLAITKSAEGKVSSPGKSWEYDLNTLWVAHVVRPADRLIDRDGHILTIIPKQVLLAFDVDGALEQRQVLLARTPVTGPLKDQQALEHRLDNWTELCSRVESLILPQTKRLALDEPFHFEFGSLLFG